MSWIRIGNPKHNDVTPASSPGSHGAGVTVGSTPDPLVTVADALGEVSRMPVAKPMAKQYEQTRQRASGETKDMDCNNAGGETKEVTVLQREYLCELTNASGETKTTAVPKRTERT